MRLMLEGDNIAKVAAILINVADMEANTDPGEPWGRLHLKTCAQLAFKGHNYLVDHLADVPGALERLRSTPTPERLEVIAFLENWLCMHADVVGLVSGAFTVR